ncbi:MAG: hypothetical protein DRI65_09660 [Chloroflexota bacterium]|nr:MAG: hypothetical protein DRI65_09660 [Chloroflexota bacterium]
MWRKRKEPGLIKSEREKRRGKKIKPREINIESLPYFPLPPAPSKWDPSTYAYESFDIPENFFEARKGDQLSIESITKIEMEDRPDPAFKTSYLQASGVLFIDKTGKCKAYPNAHATMLRRNFQGKKTAEAELEHDIYRIGTNPHGDHSVFLSGEAYLHAYNENIEPILVHDMASDERIRMIRESEIWMDGPPRRQIRRVDINPAGDRLLFTIADTAWCISPNLDTLWAVCMPLEEGWKRTYTRSTLTGNRVDVENALRFMELNLPVTQDEIKSQYRQLAFRWHPDYTGDTPENNKKMQELNRTFSILTGIDPRKLEIKNSEVVSFKRTKADIEINVGHGRTFEITIDSGGPLLDWIYAADFCSSSDSVYIGSYAGKIIKIDEKGIPRYVIDVGITPDTILEIENYLYITTDTRLYVLGPDLELINLIDLTLEGRLLGARNGFYLVAEKKISVHNRQGEELGEIISKHPIRAVYESGEKLIVESRQHRAVIEITP